MIKSIHFLIVLAAFILNSCSSDSHEEEVAPVEPTDNFYLNFELKGFSYKVSSDGYSLHTSYKGRCAKDWIDGANRVSLQIPTDAGFITKVDFWIRKKVFKDELDPSNSLSYLGRVMNASTSSIGFPINQNGYYEEYDLENSVFLVNRNLSAEAYLFISTEDEFYRSDSVVPNERDPRSFIRIERVIENTGMDSYDYPYIIEGKFAINLFEGMYGTTSQLVRGNFRWPIGRVEDSELLSLCR
ncbi:MAG: hypothetical protein QY309_00255 [Cyclobacteriaceae bacterium]|nr:MAG: hypothetical protein QY309_00255 [Cyclobacteriaceae bacterium]